MAPKAAAAALLTRQSSYPFLGFITATSNFFFSHSIPQSVPFTHSIDFATFMA
jgi:hypothetical protein